LRKNDGKGIALNHKKILIILNGNALYSHKMYLFYFIFVCIIYSIWSR